jgi:hypothetical protein
LVRELSNGRMTHGEAKELLACYIDFTLPLMTEKEKQS